MERYTRGEISQITGIGFDAIRFYEKKGLLSLPSRGSNNYRQYDEDTVTRLNFIKQSKICGFTLNEIKNTLEQLDNPENCTVSSDDIIDGKMKEIDYKIAELIKMKNMLEAIKEPLRNRSCEQIISLNIN